MPTVTFLDADVLINAFRGKGDIATAAQEVGVLAVVEQKPTISPNLRRSS